VLAALSLRIHALLERSYANGPGCRAVVWTQGCSIRCPGCFNPEAQAPDGGRDITVPDLLRRVRSIPGIEGVTISGGEPLEQHEAVGVLLHDLRRTTRLSIVLFSGYPWEHIVREPAYAAVTSLADVVIAGPFRRRQRLEHALLGSANQTIHLLTRRYALADLEAVPEMEVVLDEQRAILTGVSDANLT